ncbi:MAG: acetate--CoA ligase family protein [Deltaproteobacteria bacterium]|nr:acetate--CoA ligase family protein [Deltaproteobacteria bacterium]
MDCFFKAKAVAIVGASPSEGKLSNVIMQSMKDAAFPGEVFYVNPKYPAKNYYPDIRSIGKPVDMAVFAMSAEYVPGLLKGLGGVLKGAVVVSGGFSETGAVGAAHEKALLETARNEGIRLIGPNCLGIYDTVSGVDTFFIPRERAGRPRKGRIAILSQSGSFALTAMDEMAAEGLGVSRVVSYGNRVDVSEAECLDFLSTDEHTDVVIVYIEGINNGRAFVEAARRCSAKKTVLAYKVGRYGSAERAARSHTGSIAGRYEIYRAAFKKAGVVELGSYEELMDSCRVLSKSPVMPKGRRVAIITDGGGMGVGIADACEAAGLDVTQLAENKANELRSVFPAYFTVSNPIDLTGSVTDEWYALSLKTVLEGDGYDMAIVAALWGPPGLTDKLPMMLAEEAQKAAKPVIICSPGGSFTLSKRALFEKAGLPVFSTPEGAVRAASVLVKKSVLNHI